MIIALACYSNEDMPKLLAQYSYISNLREEMMELFCCSGISTLNTKFNISLLLALLAYSTQNQKTQMCDYIIMETAPPCETSLLWLKQLLRIDMYPSLLKIAPPSQ